MLGNGFEGSTFACTGPPGDGYSENGVLFKFDELGDDGLFTQLCVYFVMLMEDGWNVGVEISSNSVELVLFKFLVISEPS